MRAAAPSAAGQSRPGRGARADAHVPTGPRLFGYKGLVRAESDITIERPAAEVFGGMFKLIAPMMSSGMRKGNVRALERLKHALGEAPPPA